jgi:signal transduction histidine kinase
VWDEEGRVALAVVVYRDETKTRQLELNRDDYARAISHDLRNALTGIDGHAQLLRRTLRTAGLADALAGRSTEAIIVSTQRMNTMITDLSESARLEAGEGKFDLVPVDLPSFVMELAARLGGPAEAARIEIEAGADVPLVMADRVQLERILMNLLSNSLKYAEEDTPITVSITSKQDEVVTAVKDVGRGIAAEEVGRLFQRYYRAEATQHEKSGLGLGLYITRMLVEAQGGRIWVASEEGKGSTFTFTLPLAH